MIQRLSIKNFKSWANLENMEFGKVTAVFGPNSSGKTSLIQFLLMLKQTAESRDRRILNLGGTERDYVDLGSYEDVVYGHDISQHIIFKLDFAFGPDQTYFQAKNDEELTKEYAYSASIRYKNKILELKNLSLVHYGGLYGLNSSAAATEPIFHVLLVENDDKERNFTIEKAPQMLLNTEDLQIWNNNLFDVDWYSKSGVNTKTKNLLQSLVRVPKIFEREMLKINYLGPLREYPKREYRWTGEVLQGIGIRGEYAIQAMLSKIQPTSLNDSKNLIKEVSKWLKRFGVIDELDLSSISDNSRLFELKIKSKNYAHWANLMDVGFGVSQVLPVIVLAYFAPPGSLIILEQPEIHLHPRVQAELADLFLEVALTRNVQFFIESHSEHLLMRLQRRIAERSGEFADLTEDDVKLYFCKRETEASTLEPLEMDEYGRIKNWPKDFFGDPLGERAAMTQAMLARKMAASGKNGHTNLNS